MTHLGVHSGGGHQAGGPTPGDHRGGEEHIAPLCQRGVGGEGSQGPLIHRGGLAGHGGFVGLEAGGLQNAAVGGHQIPRLQADHVAGHQPVRLHPGQHPVPQGVGRRGGHLAQCLQSLAGAVLLGQGDNGVHRHDAQNDGGVQPVLSPAGPQGQGRCRQQHQNHGVLQLAQQPDQEGLVLFVGQFVGPVSHQPPGGLRPGQSALIASQFLQRLLGAVRIPLCHGDRSSPVCFPAFGYIIAGPSPGIGGNLAGRTRKKRPPRDAGAAGDCRKSGTPLFRGGCSLPRAGPVRWRRTGPTLAA